MIKKWIFCGSVALTITVLSSSFKPSDSDYLYANSADVSHEMSYVFPSLNPQDYNHLKVPFTGKFFIGFKEALAFKESQGKYHKINSLGYMGKYQFGRDALASIGIHDSAAFLRNPKLQEKAFITLLSKNKADLQDEINEFEGQTIAGVKITESGILAAAHLGGTRSVKRFLNSNGKKKCRDQYGSSVKSYMRDFAGYETAGIVANSNAKI